MSIIICGHPNYSVIANDRTKMINIRRRDFLDFQPEKKYAMEAKELSNYSSFSIINLNLIRSDNSHHLLYDWKPMILVKIITAIELLTVLWNIVDALKYSLGSSTIRVSGGARMLRKARKMISPQVPTINEAVTLHHPVPV